MKRFVVLLFILISVYYLERYTKDMKREKSRLVFDAKEYGRDRIFINAFEMADTFYMFFSEKKHKKRMLYVQRLDKESFKPVGKMEHLATTSVFGESARQPGRFFMQLNEDKSQLAILATVPGVKEKKARFTVQVFGKGLKLLWKQELQLPYEGNLFRIRDFLFGPQGHVHVLGKVFDKYETDCNKRKKIHKWILITAYADGSHKEARIDSKGDPYITNLRLFQDTDSTIMCLGFYVPICITLASYTSSGLAKFIFRISDLKLQSEAYVAYTEVIIPPSET